MVNAALYSYLCLASHSTIESSERDNLLLIDNVLQITDCFPYIHILYSLSRLTSILLKIYTNAHLYRLTLKCTLRSNPLDLHAILNKYIYVFINEWPFTYTLWNFLVPWSISPSCYPTIRVSPPLLFNCGGLSELMLKDCCPSLPYLLSTCPPCTKGGVVCRWSHACAVGLPTCSLEGKKDVLG